MCDALYHCTTLLDTRAQIYSSHYNLQVISFTRCYPTKPTKQRNQEHLKKLHKFSLRFRNAKKFVVTWRTRAQTYSSHYNLQVINFTRCYPTKPDKQRNQEHLKKWHQFSPRSTNAKIFVVTWRTPEQRTQQIVKLVKVVNITKMQ